jgi:hypothetical protein
MNVRHLATVDGQNWARPDAPLPGGRAPVWVKLRRTQCEQKSSELPLKTDIAQYSRHVSKVPLSDSCAAATVPLFDTSSARSSSCGGTSRPSAFAVLRLITSSYLVGACIGRSERVLVLEDAVDVTGRLPEQVNWIGPLADQAPASDVIAVRIGRAEYLKGPTALFVVM